jgi:hypothetical protein
VSLHRPHEVKHRHEFTGWHHHTENKNDHCHGHRAQFNQQDNTAHNGAGLGAAELIGIHDRVQICWYIEQTGRHQQREGTLYAVVLAQVHR